MQQLSGGRPLSDFVDLADLPLEALNLEGDADDLFSFDSVLKSRSKGMLGEGHGDDDWETVESLDEDKQPETVDAMVPAAPILARLLGWLAPQPLLALFACCLNISFSIPYSPEQKECVWLRERERAWEKVFTIWFIPCSPSDLSFRVCSIWGSPGSSIGVRQRRTCPHFSAGPGQWGWQLALVCFG